MIRPLNFIGLIHILALLATGCGQSSEQARLDRVHDLMTDKMEPAVEGIWDSAGWIVTEEGEEELWPTTDEGWQRVIESAEKVAEAARALQTSRYAASEDDWNEIADGLIGAANRAKRAAADRDKQELFDAGGHLYRVCVACHQRYMTEDHEVTVPEDAS